MKPSHDTSISQTMWDKVVATPAGCQTIGSAVRSVFLEDTFDRWHHARMCETQTCINAKHFVKTDLLGSVVREARRKYVAGGTTRPLLAKTFRVKYSEMKKALRNSAWAGVPTWKQS